MRWIFIVASTLDVTASPVAAGAAPTGLVSALEAGAPAAAAEADTIPPTIASARVIYDPADPEETALLEFVFSEPVEWFDAIHYNSYLDVNTGMNANQGFWWPPNRSTVLFPSGFYGYGTCEQVRVTNVTDLAGNVMVDDGIGNVFTFHLEQLHMEGRMSEHMKAHDAPPHTFALEGDLAPLTSSPLCDVELYDADDDSVWTQNVFFCLPCTTATSGPVAGSVEVGFSHQCNELESPSAPRLFTLDPALHADGRDTLDAWWNDWEPGLGVDRETGRAAAALSLAISPNPASGATTVSFALPEPARVVLDVLDVGGRRVRRLVDGELAAGAHRATWNARSDESGVVPAGVYFAKLVAGSTAATKRLVIAR